MIYNMEFKNINSLVDDIKTCEPLFNTISEYIKELTKNDNAPVSELDLADCMEYWQYKDMFRRSILLLYMYDPNEFKLRRFEMGLNSMTVLSTAINSLFKHLVLDNNVLLDNILFELLEIQKDINFFSEISSGIMSYDDIISNDGGQVNMTYYELYKIINICNVQLTDANVLDFNNRIISEFEKSRSYKALNKSVHNGLLATQIKLCGVVYEYLYDFEYLYLIKNNTNDIILKNSSYKSLILDSTIAYFKDYIGFEDRMNKDTHFSLKY